jgi:hypothetical protein
MKPTPTLSRSNLKSPPKADHKRALSLIRECSEAKTIDDAFKIITNEVCVLVGGLGGSIWVVSSDDPNKIVLRWRYWSEGPNKVGTSSYTNELDANGYYDGLTGWVFATGKPLCLRDITDKAEINKYEHLKWKDKYGAYKAAKNPAIHKHFVAVPVFSCRPANKVIAVLRIGDTPKSCPPFSPADIRLLQTYAGYISGLLTNYIKREEEKTLIEGLFKVANLSDLNSLLEETARSIPVVMDGSHCSIFLRDHAGNFSLRATSARHLQKYTERTAKANCLRYRPGEGKTGIVASSGVTCRESGNITSSAGKSADMCECGTTSSAFLGVAIRDKNGVTDGVVRVIREVKVNDQFDAADQLFLEGFGQKLHACLSMLNYFTTGTCFVVMPIGKGLDKLYSTVIKKTVEKFPFVCRREDEYPSIGLLTSGIISHIVNASFIIADLTGDNPNVYYELGIAHALEKTVILISQGSAPSDVRHWKYIHYNNELGEAERLAEELYSAIKEALDTQKVMTSRAE